LRSPFQPDDELHRDSAAASDSAGRTGSAGAARSSGGRDTGRQARTGGTGLNPAPEVRIETAGLMDRVWRVPVPAGNLSNLAVNDGALFWQSRASGPNPEADLMGLAIGNDGDDPVTVVSGIRSSELSADGKKVLVRKGDDLYVVDAKAAAVRELTDQRVDLRGWTFPINVRDDWRQIFTDAWRLERDYFYDPGMHGVDWTGVRDRYLPLVDRVTTRAELSELIGEAVGELSALHTSVGGGDLREGRDNVRVPTLGARLARDPAAGGYVIEHIYRHDPDYPDERSPLADPELGIQQGDVIVAVNGVAALEPRDLGALLRNQADRQVLLRVRSGQTERDVVVVPRANEFQLRYADWVEGRREYVEEAGAGAIGYVHLSAMGSGNLTEWYRQFYPVFNRQGLIIDVRDNNGGNIDAFILEKLMRKAWMYWKSRVGEPYWNMHYAFRGHMVVLVDQNTASDGEAFADGFRRLGLGPVIGTRTWGGEIWLSSANRLSDGGLARAPMNGVYGPEGEWLIEQIGVVPDVAVDNLPHATFNGQDMQLDAALAYLKQKIMEDPRPVPAAPPYPRRAFEYRAEGPGR
jgi:tricorn protease